MSRIVLGGNQIGGSGDSSNVFVQPEAPESPAEGDIWVDSDEAVPTFNIVGTPSVGQTIQWDGTKWVPYSIPNQLLPHTAVITGATPPLTSTSYTFSYQAQFTGTAWQTFSQNSSVSFELLLEAGTYRMQWVHSKNNTYSIAEFLLNDASIATVDAYAGPFSAGNVAVINGITVPRGRSTIRVQHTQRNAASVGWNQIWNAIQFVRTGA